MSRMKRTQMQNLFISLDNNLIKVRNDVLQIDTHTYDKIKERYLEKDWELKKSLGAEQ